MQTQPNFVHLASLALCLRHSAFPAADQLLAPASLNVVELSGETTVRSKAAGFPIIQLGTRMSFELLLLLLLSYIASFLSSGLSPSSGRYISSSLHLYNSLVDPQDSITHESVSDSPLSQKVLSSKIEDQQFNHLFHNASVTDRARLLSISSPHASAWLSVTPSPRLNLHLEPAEFQVALKWWLGIQWSKAKVALTVLPVCWMTLTITPSLANMEGMWFRDTISSGMCFMTSANALAWVHVWKWVVGQDPILNPALQMFLFLTGTLANRLPLTCPSCLRYNQVLC